jgi:hypothetical protein
VVVAAALAVVPEVLPYNLFLYYVSRNFFKF